ncbi:MAG TPA: zinc ABC transporter substrate-binding protein [Methylomirabilota bacterium]
MTRGIIALGLTLLVAGCGAGSAPDKPQVVATVYPLWEFSRQVAGARAEAVALVPPGVEPHDWEPSPRDVALAQRATVFVHSGTGLDAWAERLLAGGASRPVVVDTSRGLDLIRSGGVVDPHTWLDPRLAHAQVDAIAAGLARADPAGRDTYAANARAYGARLDALDRAFSEGLRDCARREVVTAHAAFGYLTRRYGLTEVPIMGLRPETEPSPADMAALVKRARGLGVTHVFFEPLVSPRIAETLGREIGARPLPLDPVEGLAPEDVRASRGYVEVMEANLANLRTALACR